MATAAARMMLAKSAKPSFPLHLLRGSLSAASAPLNLNLNSNFPVDLQQIPLRGNESSVPAYGLSSLLQQLRSADLNRVEFRKKSVPAKDDDSDDDDFKDSSDLDESLDDDYLTEDFVDDEDEDWDDDEDEKAKGKKW